MRKLMWFTLGFAAACGICAWMWEIPNLLGIAAGQGIIATVLWIGLRRIGWVRRTAAVLLGLAAGFGWFGAYSSFYLDAITGLDGETDFVTAMCTDYGYSTDYGTAVDAVVYLEGSSYQAWLYFSGEPELEPGDYVRGVFRFQLTTPGGDEGATYHQGKGIFLLGYQEEDAQQVKGEELPWYLYPACLRHQLLDLIDSCFPADTVGFAKALLLGDRTDIDYETNTAFRVSGIMHIIAVSGLHVSILFGLIHTLTLRRRIPTALLGIPVLVLFAAVAGFTPSVTRACIMQILMLLAMAFDREYDPPTELAFSALVMLTANPLVITSVSFQLSVAAMAGIFLFYRRIYDWMTKKLNCKAGSRCLKPKRWYAGSVSVSLSAMSLTVPLTAWHFGTVSLAGILTNLLTLWAVNLIFYGVMAVCFVGWFYAGAAAALAKGISYLVRYVLLAAKVLAKIPLAAVYTRSVYVVLWLIFVYMLLGVFLFSRKRSPGVLACCGAVGLCLALGASWLEPAMDDCRMTVLDVGQGQSIVLQSQGRTWLVDCGGDYDQDAADLAAETLMSQGVFRLDGIILTHFDRDHSGGLQYFLTRMDADVLLMPEAQDPDGVGAALEALTDGNVVYVSEDLVLSYEDTELTVFGPVLTNSDNESSLAVLFQAANCDILITGDRSGFGERVLLREYDLPQLETLVVGHHGSKSSTCVELLEAAKPAVAAISVGENYYGLPANELLERLAEFGCVVYRTDRDGTLIFRR